MNAVVRIVVFIAVFVILFSPRPFFKPDWLTSLREALERNDCSATDQILHLARLDGLPGWRYANALVQSQRKCRFSNSTDQDVAEASAYIENTNPPDTTGLDNFYNDARDTSLASEMWTAITIASRPKGVTDLSVYRAEVSIVPSCWHLARPDAGGVPTYTYMSMALSRRLLTLEDILAIREADHAFCARRAIATAKRMAAVDGLNELSLPVMGLWRLAERLEGARFEVEYEHLQWVRRASALADEGVLIPAPTGQYYEPERTYFTLKRREADDARRCYPPTVSKNPLVLLDCTRQRLSGPLPPTDIVRPGLESRKAEVDALYTLFRAERLGADTRPLYERAVGELSAGCIQEIRRAEATDALSREAIDKGVEFFRLQEAAACKATGLFKGLFDRLFAE